jgi:coenzyme F420 hydrogenase subunit beta
VLREAARRVVAAGNCSGCGLCPALDPGLRMDVVDGGWARPVPVEAPQGSVAAPDAGRAFAAGCPGRRVRAQRPAGTTRHPVFGPVAGAWQAWATDPVVRRAGSSGGAITALSAFALSSGRAAHAVSARSDRAHPLRSTTTSVVDPADLLAGAGSRYAPVSTVAAPDASSPAGVTVGKPCEVSAVRAVADLRGERAPLLLSFFCAGTPAQQATEDLVRTLGADPADVVDLRYRGDGWPGSFVARLADGGAVRTGYDESWGAHLGPTTQWRCKLCPDGTGESADLVAGDFWQADERGYPVFAEQDGRSALIARTAAGRELVEAAVAAGVLTAETVDLDAVAAVQPLQVGRRRTLWGRLAGARLARRPVPRYRGFGLLRAGLDHPRETVRAARGTRRRARAAGHAGRRTPAASPQGGRG